jgi:hypothetical protein
MNMEIKGVVHARLENQLKDLIKIKLVRQDYVVDVRIVKQMHTIQRRRRFPMIRFCVSGIKEIKGKLISKDLYCHTQAVASRRMRELHANGFKFVKYKLVQIEEV